jgi:hypothetical protein
MTREKFAHVQYRCNYFLKYFPITISGITDAKPKDKESQTHIQLYVYIHKYILYKLLTNGARPNSKVRKEHGWFVE